MYDYEKHAGYQWEKDNIKEVAETASVLVSDVEDLLKKYDDMQKFHQWLKERKENDQPMPESQDDLMNIYRIERPSFLFKKPER